MMFAEFANARCTSARFAGFEACQCSISLAVAALFAFQTHVLHLFDFVTFGLLAGCAARRASDPFVQASLQRCLSPSLVLHLSA